MLKKSLLTTFLFLSAILSSFALADTVEDMLERAREKAKKTNKIEQILKTEPDQTVRLMMLEEVINSGTETQRNIVIDAGLSSTDKLLKAAAFKAAIMSLDKLHITLTVNPDSSENILQKSKERIKIYGDQYLFPVKAGLNKKEGIFGNGGSQKGQIIGTHITISSHGENGLLELEGINKVVGKISLRKGGQQFIGTAKIR